PISASDGCCPTKVTTSEGKIRRVSLVPPLDRFRTIVMLGLPIMGGMLSQSLLNLVDAAMVGSLGQAALAGVGLGGYVNFMAIALVMGLGVVVQASAAGRRGHGLVHHSAGRLNDGRLIAALIVLPRSLLCWFSAGVVLAQLRDEPEVTAMGADYFRWRALAIIAV